jgi:hypothetical protein
MSQLYTGKLELDSKVLSVDFTNEKHLFHVPLETNDTVVIKNQKGFPVAKGTYSKNEDGLTGFLTVPVFTNVPVLEYLNPICAQFNLNKKMNDLQIAQLFDETKHTAFVSRDKVNTVIPAYIYDRQPKVSRHLLKAEVA